MSKEPAGTPTTEEREDPIDRFEHEMEALEEPMGHSVRQWLVGVVVAAVVVGGFFVGSFLLNKNTGKDAASLSALPSIDMMEPKRGALPAIPYIFRWEAISETNTYLVRLQSEGSGVDLFTRETKAPQIELTLEERGKMGSGGKFQWFVEARAKYGKPIAAGQSKFSF